MAFFNNSIYGLELVIAELVFLWGMPKRKWCLLRMLPFTICAMLLSRCVYSAMRSLPIWQAQLGLVAIISITIAGVMFSFEGTWLPVLSACTSGVALQHIAHHISLLIAMPFGRWLPVYELIATTVLSAIVYLLFGKWLKKQTECTVFDKRITLICIVIVMICTGLTRFTRNNAHMENQVKMAVSLYSIVCCVLALGMQHYLIRWMEAEKERVILAQIRQEEQKQYQISRGTSEQLHIIYHDLKHKLSTLQHQLPAEEIRDMKNTLDAYGMHYQTGLDALDVVLNEKSLYAMGKNITLTFLGNGKDLEFMSQMEIYSMFSNLLDNAIAAAEKLSKPEEKVISLVEERRGQMVSINIMNFMEEAEISFVDDLPASTKTQEPGFHGYGLRSVRSTANKYGGEITVSAMGNIFMVNIYMMPEPENGEGA